MIYLSGHRTKHKHPMVGLMQTPDTRYRIPPDVWWAFDNACFAHPGEFAWDRYERTLRRHVAYAGDRLLFAVAPDVPFDGDGTIRRFEDFRTKLRGLGVPIAFVTQNGMNAESPPWGDIQSIFIGGDSQWKVGPESAEIVAAANHRGMWTHMGRVNSLRRMRQAQAMGCKSVDGTYLKYGPDVNWPRLVSWLKEFE